MFTRQRNAGTLINCRVSDNNGSDVAVGQVLPSCHLAQISHNGAFHGMCSESQSLISHHVHHWGPPLA